MEDVAAEVGVEDVVVVVVVATAVALVEAAVAQEQAEEGVVILDTQPFRTAALAHKAAVPTILALAVGGHLPSLALCSMGAKWEAAFEGTCKAPGRLAVVILTPLGTLDIREWLVNRFLLDFGRFIGQGMATLTNMEQMQQWLRNGLVETKFSFNLFQTLLRRHGILLRSTVSTRLTG